MGELPALKQLYADLNIQIFNMKKLVALLLISPLVFAENQMIPLDEYIRDELDRPNSDVTANKMIYVNYRCIALNFAFMDLMGSDMEDQKNYVENNIILFMNSGFNLYAQIIGDKPSDDPWQDYLDSVGSQTKSMKESYLFQTNKDWQNTGSVLGGEFIKNDFEQCESWKELINKE